MCVYFQVKLDGANCEVFPELFRQYRQHWLIRTKISLENMRRFSVKFRVAFNIEVNEVYPEETIELNGLVDLTIADFT